MNKEIKTEIEINAPAAKVWGILKDFESYSLWNPFVVSVEGKAEKGAQIKISVQIPNSGLKKFTPIILKADENRELRWTGSLPLNLFRGEHFFIIEPIDEHKIRFVHGENLSGWLIRMIWFLQGEKLQKGYQLMNEALKRRAEASE